MTQLRAVVLFVRCLGLTRGQTAAQLRVAMGDGPSFGWHVDASSMRHDWATMVENVRSATRCTLHACQ